MPTKTMLFCTAQAPTHLVLPKHHSHPHHSARRNFSQHVPSNLFSWIFQEIPTSSSKSVLPPLAQRCRQSYTNTHLTYFLSLQCFTVDRLWLIIWWFASFPVTSNVVPHKRRVFHATFTSVVVTAQGPTGYQLNMPVKNWLVICPKNHSVLLPNSLLSRTHIFVTFVSFFEVSLAPEPRRALIPKTTSANTEPTDLGVKSWYHSMQSHRFLI